MTVPKTEMLHRIQTLILITGLLIVSSCFVRLVKADRSPGSDKSRSSSVTELRFEPKDEARSRTVPIKVYLGEKEEKP